MLPSFLLSLHPFLLYRLLLLSKFVQNSFKKVLCAANSDTVTYLLCQHLSTSHQPADHYLFRKLRILWSTYNLKVMLIWILGKLSTSVNSNHGFVSLVRADGELLYLPYLVVYHKES